MAIVQHRIIFLKDEAHKIKRDQRLGDLLKHFKGQSCLGIQLDLYTNTDSIHRECIAALSVTSTVVTETALKLNEDCVELAEFPDAEHTGVAIREWLLTVLEREKLPLKAISGCTPAGDFRDPSTCKQDRYMQSTSESERGADLHWHERQSKHGTKPRGPCCGQSIWQG